MGANAASAATTGAKIAIVMGSKSDWATMQFAAEVLTQLDVPFHVEVVSAHRTPDKLFSFAEQATANGFDVIIAGAAVRRTCRACWRRKLWCRCWACRCKAPR